MEFVFLFVVNLFWCDSSMECFSETLGPLNLVSHKPSWPLLGLKRKEPDTGVCTGLPLSFLPTDSQYLHSWDSQETPRSTCISMQSIFHGSQQKEERASRWTYATLAPGRPSHFRHYRNSPVEPTLTPCRGVETGLDQIHSFSPEMREPGW